MKKIIRKFSYIMIANLLVFLSIGHILDLNLGTDIKYKIIFLIISTITLIFFSKRFLKKDLEKIQKDIGEDNNKNINKK